MATDRGLVVVLEALFLGLFFVLHSSRLLEEFDSSKLRHEGGAMARSVGMSRQIVAQSAYFRTSRQDSRPFESICPPTKSFEEQYAFTGLHEGWVEKINNGTHTGQYL